MKHYSLYEIEKLTDGKLTKYRLKQAIKSGLLRATHSKPLRKGPGAPNCTVTQEDLDLYLMHLRTNKTNKIEIDTQPSAAIDILKERISVLEKESSVQNSFIRTFMEEHEKETKKKNKLLEELSSIQTLSEEQRVILEKLIHIH